MTAAITVADLQIALSRLPSTALVFAESYDQFCLGALAVHVSDGKVVIRTSDRITSDLYGFEVKGEYGYEAKDA